MKPAVLDIVIGAVLRVGGKSIKTRFALAAFAFVALFAFDMPFPLVVFGAALLSWLKSRSTAVQGCTAHCEEEEDVPEHARPSASRSLRVLATWVPLWLGPVLVIGLLFGWDDISARLAVFFSKMAVVTFGGAYAVLSYVAQQAVDGYGWLSPAAAWPWPRPPPVRSSWCSNMSASWPPSPALESCIPCWLERLEPR